MKKYKIAFWEFVLILGSVLIFRSMWIFLDLLIGTDVLRLWLSLLIGVAIALMSLILLNKDTKKDEK
jgi:hypothetical protein